LSSLRILRKNAIFDLHEVEKQYKQHLPDRVQVRAFKKYCFALHQIAYVEILEDINFANYSSNLIRSAENWLHLLKQLNSGKDTVPTSFLLPLFGVLAIGSNDLASDIANNASDKKVPPEYDDEFYYADLLHHLVLENKVELENCLQRYEESLGDEDSTRLQVCKSIAERNEPEFLDAIATLNENFINEMEVKASMPSVSPAEINAARHVWLEGIALIRLANSYGIKSSFDYLSIPYAAVAGKAKLTLNDCILGISPYQAS